MPSKRSRTGNDIATNRPRTLFNVRASSGTGSDVSHSTHRHLAHRRNTPSARTSHASPGVNKVAEEATQMAITHTPTYPGSRPVLSVPQPTREIVDHPPECSLNCESSDWCSQTLREWGYTTPYQIDYQSTPSFYTFYPYPGSRPGLTGVFSRIPPPFDSFICAHAGVAQERPGPPVYLHSPPFLPTSFGSNFRLRKVVSWEDETDAD